VEYKWDKVQVGTTHGLTYKWDQKRDLDWLGRENGIRAWETGGKDTSLGSAKKTKTNEGLVLSGSPSRLWQRWQQQLQHI